MHCKRKHILIHPNLWSRQTFFELIILHLSQVLLLLSQVHLHRRVRWLQFHLFFHLQVRRLQSPHHLTILQKKTNMGANIVIKALKEIPKITTLLSVTPRLRQTTKPLAIRKSLNVFVVRNSLTKTY